MWMYVQILPVDADAVDMQPLGLCLTHMHLGINNLGCTHWRLWAQSFGRFFVVQPASQLCSVTATRGTCKAQQLVLMGCYVSQVEGCVYLKKNKKKTGFAELGHLGQGELNKYSALALLKRTQSCHFNLCSAD